MVTRLEERGRHAVFSGMIRRYFSTLATDRPLAVLDLGRGTGVVARHACDTLHPAWSIQGADVSQGLLQKALRLSHASTGNDAFAAWNAKRFLPRT